MRSKIIRNLSLPAIIMGLMMTKCSFGISVWTNFGNVVASFIQRRPMFTLAFVPNPASSIMAPFRNHKMPYPKEKNCVVGLNCTGKSSKTDVPMEHSSGLHLAMGIKYNPGVADIILSV